MGDLHRSDGLLTFWTNFPTSLAGTPFTMERRRLRRGRSMIWRSRQRWVISLIPGTKMPGLIALQDN